MQATMPAATAVLCAFTPLSRSTPPPGSGARHIASVGYAAFGFALGVTAGVLIRRTVPTNGSPTEAG
jgi:hypothetical protein